MISLFLVVSGSLKILSFRNNITLKRGFPASYCDW